MGYQALVHQAPIPQPQVVTTSEFTNYMKANDAIQNNMQTNMTSFINSNLELKNMFGQFMNMNTASSSGSGTLPSNTVTNPKEDLKGITTRSGIAYKGPTIPTASSSSKVVEREIEVTKDTPVVAPIVDPVEALVSAPKPNPKPSILYSSRLHDQKLRDKANDQKEKFFQIFQDLNFNIGFADALILMPKRINSSCWQKAVTFNLDQTLRYSANYDSESINRIDVIDIACVEYSQEILGFFGDILLLEEFLNDDPSSPPLPPQELKVVEPKNEKSSIDEPPVVELNDLPPHLEYAFLEGDDKLPVIIAKDLKDEEKTALIKVLKSHKQDLAWQLSDIKGINLKVCTHKILMEDGFKPAIQHQRRVNPKIHKVIKKEVLELLDAGLIYPISDSPWVSPVQCVPKRCMLAIFHDIIEKTMEVFMDDFSIFGNSFGTCLSHLNKMLKRCEDTNLCLNWEKSHFMVKEGIVLGHKISKNGIEVDKAKVDVIAKLPHPTTV
nr:DNA-directed DNA polymerase [Tanacetum cinerariifolium]